MGALIINYNEPHNKVSIAYYFNHKVCELVIQKEGICNLNALDEFLRAQVKTYRSDMLSNKVIDSITQQIFWIIARSENSIQLLSEFLADLTEILNPAITSLTSAEEMILAKEGRLPCVVRAPQGCKAQQDSARVFN